jgi:hypothetical protein
MVKFSPIGPVDEKGMEICADCASGNHSSHDPLLESVFIVKQKAWSNWRDMYDCKNELINDKCGKCNGTGDDPKWKTSLEDESVVPLDCEVCDGSGKVIPRTVAQCCCRATMPTEDPDEQA